MSGYRIYNIQATVMGPGSGSGSTLGKSLITSGGAAIVTGAGSPEKLTLYDPDDGFKAMDNPVSLTRGKIRFAVEEDILSVDVFALSPNGQFGVVESARADENSELFFDGFNKHQMLKIPFSIEDTAAATETETGIEVPANAAVGGNQMSAGVVVVTEDATQTIDVGTLSSGTNGDADGLIDGTSVATAGRVASTDGALIATNTPWVALEGNERQITYTLNAGTDTAEGYILLPYTLA